MTKNELKAALYAIALYLEGNEPLVEINEPIKDFALGTKAELSHVGQVIDVIKPLLEDKNK